MDRSKNTVYLPALTEYRAATMLRRAAAFCDAPEYILGSKENPADGIEVLPLTPATFSMLIAFKSAFLSKNLPREHDVRNYVWAHSRLFAHCGVSDWRDRKKVALHRLDPERLPWWRRTRANITAAREQHVARLVAAAIEIQALVDDAFADAPARSGKPGKPLATLEGALIHEFAVAYGWQPERTRHTPLRQLFQLHRCVRADRREDVSDEGENRIIAAHLDARNASLAAVRGGKS